MPPRKFLHWLRQIDTWLIAPAVVVVVLGELTHSALVDELEHDFWDKSLHFTAYFGLALMTTIAVRADRRALCWALGLVALGGALEIVQGLTGRDADIFDEVANTLGAATGLGLGWAGIALLRARRVVEDETPPSDG